MVSVFKGFYAIITPEYSIRGMVPPYLFIGSLMKYIKINYIGRIDIPDNFLEQHKTETGYVKVSNPVFTAMDLLQYEKHIGGINRAATVIN